MPEDCPICGSGIDTTEQCYSLGRKIVVTCEACRTAVGGLVIEEKMGLRRSVLGRSNDPEKIRARIHAAVLAYRGLSPRPQDKK